MLYPIELGEPNSLWHTAGTRANQAPTAVAETGAQNSKARPNASELVPSCRPVPFKLFKYDDMYSA